jgi:hypothetical protein
LELRSTIISIAFWVASSVWIVLADGHAASLIPSDNFRNVKPECRLLYLKASFAEADDQVFDHFRLPPDR